MASTNFLQWNPSAINQETDAAYAADSQRVGGAVLDAPFPSPTANKLFFQASTMMTALANAFVAKGYSPSDANLAALTAVLQNIITNADLAAGVALGNGSTATTQSTSDNSTKLATTAFAQALLSGGGGGAVYTTFRGAPSAPLSGVTTAYTFSIPASILNNNSRYRMRFSFDTSGCHTGDSVRVLFGGSSAFSIDPSNAVYGGAVSGIDLFGVQKNVVNSQIFEARTISTSGATALQELATAISIGSNVSVTVTVNLAAGGTVSFPLGFTIEVF